MNAVKKLYRSLIKRPMQRFNVENRAQRVIDKPKPKRAPLHASTVNRLKDIEREFPEEYDAQKTKDENLLKMMHGMVANPDRMNELPQRNLPSSTLPAMDPYFESERQTAAEGKVTLKDAIEFIGDHQFSPEPPSASAIALRYQLSVEDVEAILRCFRSFKIYYEIDEEDLEELQEARRKQLAAEQTAPPAGNSVSALLQRLGVKKRADEKSQQPIEIAADLQAPPGSHGVSAVLQRHGAKKHSDQRSQNEIDTAGHYMDMDFTDHDMGAAIGPRKNTHKSNKGKDRNDNINTISSKTVLNREIKSEPSEETVIAPDSKFK